MVPAGRGFPRFDRLDVRLVILLGIALLPIGLIATTQTLRMMAEVEARTSSALLGESVEAAARQRSDVMNAMGATRALASVGPALLRNTDECAAVFDSVRGRLDTLTFAGIVLPDGSVPCATSRGETGLSPDMVDGLFDSPSEAVAVAHDPTLPMHSALVLRQPVTRNGEAIAMVLIATSLESLSGESRSFGGTRPRDILLLSESGEVLGGQGEREGLENRLPRDRAPDRPGEDEAIFRAVDAAGVPHVYAVAPVIPGQLHAMALWDPAVLGVDRRSMAAAIAFPTLMWLASLAVAYFAVHALVIRHIRTLRRRIRAFASSRRVVDEQPAPDMPIELREVAEAFRGMTERILRDEADLENNLHEKDVLLKEVHHRVKNNLQLIASMTSMQMRKTSDARTRAILRRLHDRVLGMAAVHRCLYETSALSEVRADEVLREVANQLMRNAATASQGIRFDSRLDPVRLYPDQALPLSLLLTEALTNAVKYIGRPADGPPRISMTLTAPPGEDVTLVVENTLGEPLDQSETVEGSGLGSQLIAAFVMQLGAVSRNETTDEVFRLLVRFEPSAFSAHADEDTSGAGEPRGMAPLVKAAG